MHDTLAYFGQDPVHRPYHHDRISFAMMYAYSEHYVLALSHDEVVHGKGSLYAKMWGDPWQKRANLRALYALMYAHPGRKLLFMGSELAQEREWNHDAELDWGVLENSAHAGVKRLVRDLNLIYRTHPALYAKDDEPSGFRWIDVEDRAQSIFSFARYGATFQQQIVVICNMTPVVRHGYRVGVPQGGRWKELLNSDLDCYGGSGVVNEGSVASAPVPWQGHANSVVLSLPPLGVLWLCPETAT
jgi:1,4-alpha-glucan branching enzyme